MSGAVNILGVSYEALGFFLAMKLLLPMEDRPKQLEREVMINVVCPTVGDLLQ